MNTEETKNESEIQPQTEVERSARYTLDEFLELVEQESVNIVGRFGVLHLSSEAVGVRWNDDKTRWKMLLGDSEGIDDEGAEDIEADVLEDYLDTEVLIVFAGATITIAPIDGTPAVIVLVNFAGEPIDSLLHCEDDLRSILEGIKKQRTDLN